MSSTETKQMVTVLVDRDLHDAFKVLCQRQGKPVTVGIRDLMRFVVSLESPNRGGGETESSEVTA